MVECELLNVVNSANLVHKEDQLCPIVQKFSILGSIIFFACIRQVVVVNGAGIDWPSEQAGFYSDRSFGFAYSARFAKIAA